MEKIQGREYGGIDLPGAPALRQAGKTAQQFLCNIVITVNQVKTRNGRIREF